MADAKVLRGPKAHSVRMTLDDGCLSATYTCHAAEGADCRLTCPAGCETWDMTNHEHALVDAGSCTVVGWLEAVDELESSHVGSSVLYDGPLKYEYDDGFRFTVPNGVTPSLCGKPLGSSGHLNFICNLYAGHHGDCSWDVR